MDDLGPFLANVPQVNGVVGRGRDQRTLVDEELDLQNGRSRAAGRRRRRRRRARSARRAAARALRLPHRSKQTSNNDSVDLDMTAGFINNIFLFVSICYAFTNSWYWKGELSNLKFLRK